MNITKITDAVVTQAFENVNRKDGAIVRDQDGTNVLTDDGAVFATTLHSNKAFNKHVAASFLRLLAYGPVGAKAALMTSFAAGFEAARLVVEAESQTAQEAPVA